MVGWVLDGLLGGEQPSVLWQQPTAPSSLEDVSVAFPWRSRSKPSPQMFTWAAGWAGALQRSAALVDRAKERLFV